MTNEVDFSALGLSGQMLEAVRTKGFETPTSIQRLTIPLLLAGTNDIIAQSQTGTGKTAAFGLPILQQIERSTGGVQAIVLVPTRELALQAAEELQSFNAGRRLSITAIYGGAAMGEQLRRLSRGVDIVVGTPGRVLDHIRRGTLQLDGVRFLVLDEADEMLNMGFVEDVEEIMGHTGEDRRVMLFSATMPERIIRLSEKYMRQTQIVRVESQQLTVDLTNQIYFEVREADKFDALTRIVDVEPDFYGIVFCRTKVSADEITARLVARGYAAECLHGDVTQAMREKILRKFRDKAVNILVATDVAARGIDVSNLSHVINYALPQDSESYVHRIGRTGRAGREGTAITFITGAEFRRFSGMMRDIRADIRKEQLPSPQDIVAMKRAKIKDDLEEIISAESHAAYADMAAELLADHTPEVALSALLRLAFRSELEESSYPEIRSFSVDRKGKTRLFLALGARDGYSPRKLVDLLKRRCGLRDKNIDDLRVFDNYSFVSVPFSDAEAVVGRINASSRGRRIARIATPEGEERPKRTASRTEHPAAGERTAAGAQREDAADPRPEHSDAGQNFLKEAHDTPAAEYPAEFRAPKPGRKKAAPGRTQQPQSNETFDWEAFQRFEDASAWERPKKTTRSVRKGAAPVAAGRKAAAKRVAAKGRKRE